MPTVDVFDLNRRKVGSAERRGEVSGSGKKPWKQKHTGRARAGSLRSPIWRHGGSVFGPKPRSYAFNMPKKKYRAALQSALSSKVTDGHLFVVSSLSLEQPKTKVLVKALEQFAAGSQVLVIAGEGQTGLTQAARNLAKVNVVAPDRLNVYDIVRAGTIVIPERELARVKEVWA